MADQRRALVLSFDALPSASGKARRLAAALEAWGTRLSVDALTAKLEGEPHIERFFGARLMRIPMSGPLRTRVQMFERALRRQLAGEEYNLILCGDAIAAQTVLSRRQHMPFKVIVDGSHLWRQIWPLVAPELEGELRLRHRLLRLERQLIAQADLVLSGTEAQDALLVDLGVPSNRLRRIWPQVSLDQFPDLPPPNVPGLLVAALGGGTANEGFETALRAIALARANGLPARLSIAGPLPPVRRQALRELAESLGVGEAFELHGEIPENRVGELLSNAHVCLCLIRFRAEASTAAIGSQRIAEAMAVARPLIATDTPTFRELSGGAALYLPYDDPHELSRYLMELANDPAKAAALGQQGRKIALDRFDSSAAKKGWLRLARELVDPSGSSLLEGSNPGFVSPELHSPTLSVEPTRTAGTRDELDETRLTPTSRPDDTTYVGSERSPRGPRVPWEETPTPIKSM